MSQLNHTRNAPRVLIPQFFGCTIFDRSTSKYLPFDAETTALLRRSQTHPFPLLIAEIEDPEKREQAAAFYAHFYQQGFFGLDGCFAGVALDVEPAADHMTGPLAVHLEVVAACNLTCTHCFAGSLPRKERPLTLSEMEALFADMAQMGSFRLGLTGGEPLLRKDLFDIIDMATDYGLHPCLTTNGLLLTEEIAREFGKRKLVWLNVSLEGASPATNDRVRGSGVFERVVEKLKLLSEHARFTLAFTIMKTNAEEIEACAEFAASVGASTAVFRPLYPVGIAEQHLEELMPTFSQYNTALATLVARDGEEVRVIDPFSPSLRTETQARTHTNHGCGAANSVCSVSVSGDVNPCSFLGSAFVANNIRNQPLSTIWREGQTFQEMRRLPGGTAETFSGGCRARALAFGGAVNAPDPWVQGYEKEAKRSSPITLYAPSEIVALQRSVREAKA
ncbi:MAG: radical protein [Chthonomonadales bacterium]|nr:radical protein [Chthonomonadales bacterium]